MTSRGDKRDYIAEMRALIQSEMHDGDSPVDVAQRIVEKLHANDPELLSAWLDLRAVQLLREEIGTIERARRDETRSATRGTTSSRARFHEITQQADPVAAGIEANTWLKTRFAVQGNQRLPLGEITGQQLDYVADRYRQRSESNAFEGMFLRALRARLGDDQKVADVYTEDQIVAMRRGLAA